ncbi:MAG: oligosaccharide flippase family protein [Chitinophagales bacterium]|nr:oligosaccharide flippase family protein [Chitinophagales bacterium]MDW8418001.1 oligosaccharide flippase family protein [Chitinophagales bacterium]
MRKKFAANLIFLITANLIVKPFWIFGIDRTVQNRIGPQDYGLYFAVFNYSLLFNILLDVGLQYFNSRAVSRRPDRIGNFFINILLLKILLAILYTTFTFISATAAGFSELQLRLLLLLILNQILLSFILYFRSNLTALQRFKTDAVISVSDRLLAIIFCGMLLWYYAPSGHFEIVWFVYAQTLALGITAVMAGLLSVRHTRLTVSLWSGRTARRILRATLPFASLVLLMSIYSRTDAVMIERLHHNGKEEAGIYAAAFRLLDAANQFGYLFSVILLPLFAALIKQKSPVRQLVKLSGEWMLVTSLTLSVACVLWNREIVLLLYPAASPYWWQVFTPVILSFIPMSSVYIYGSLLTAGNNLLLLNRIAIGGVVLNILLNYLLIPRYGALAAGWVTLVTQAFTAFLHLVVAVRVFQLPVNASHVLRIFSYLVVSTLAGVLISYIALPWTINLSLYVFLSITVAFLFKLLPLQEVRNMATLFHTKYSRSNI